MSRRALRLIGTVMVGVATLVAGTSADSASPASRQDPPQTFRASADVVGVEASVRRDRRPVTGLTTADFEIRDNGVLQDVSTISYEKLPIDVTIVLDVSASVSGLVLDQLRRAVRQLRTDLGPRDRLKLVTFNMRIRRLADFEDQASTTDAGFAAITGYGSSAIFDTLAVTLTRPAPQGRRSLIVLFSDGQDSSSISDPDALLEVARRSTPTVAVVLASAVPQRPASLFAPPPASKAVTIGRLYDQIATETGGVVVPTVAGDNLTSTFKRVLDEFRATYVLYFTPRGVDRAGTHTLDVRVKRDGVEVHARRGYVWQ